MCGLGVKSVGALAWAAARGHADIFVFAVCTCDVLDLQNSKYVIYKITSIKYEKYKNHTN